MKNIDYNQIEISLLWESFKEVMKSYSVKSDVAKQLFEDVIRRYSGPGRYYHNVHHIRYMISLWESHKYLLKDPNAIFLAIIYHDFIYNPKSSENEEESCLYFMNNVLPLMKKISAAAAVKVVTAIIATKHTGLHQDDEDILYLLDFDLAILGTRHESEYEWYRTGVRKEYKMYSDSEYNAGRRAVLESFLKRKNIYLTDTFKVLHKMVRKNLQNEIKLYLC